MSNKKHIKENFTLAGKVDVGVDVLTGDLSASFFDVSSGGSVLPIGVSHVYSVPKAGDTTDYKCGKNFRLNLHQSLKKNTSDDGYVFVDESGDIHDFKDNYSYINKSGVKTGVDKSKVAVGSDGKFAYVDAPNNIFEVKKEQKTSSGLKLTDGLEGFKNSHAIDQRYEEEVRLKEAVEQYGNALKSYVKIQKTDGSITQNSAGAKALMKELFSNGKIDKEQFESYMSIPPTQLILTESEAIQYNSLLLQMTEKPSGVNGKALSNAEADYTNIINYFDTATHSNAGGYSNVLVDMKRLIKDLKDNYYKITTRSNWSDVVTKLNFQYDQYPIFLKKLGSGGAYESNNCCLKVAGPDDHYENGDYIYIQKPSNDGSRIDLRNGETDYINSTQDSLMIGYRHLNMGYCDLQAELECLTDELDAFERVQTTYDTNSDGSLGPITTNYRTMKARQKVLEQRLRLFNKEFGNRVDKVRANIEKFEKAVNKFLDDETAKLVKQQLEMLIERGSNQNINDARKYFREYSINFAELAKLERHLPVRFLSDGEIIRGFSEAGRLVVVYDNYENYAAIEYDEYDRISTATDGEVRILSFAYNAADLLASITSDNGKSVEFEYCVNEDGKDQFKAKFSNEEELTFGYDDGKLTSVESKADMLKGEIEYSSEDSANFVVKNIKQSSLMSGVNKYGCTEREVLFSEIDFEYLDYPNNEFDYGQNYTFKHRSVAENGAWKQYFFDTATDELALTASGIGASTDEIACFKHTDRKYDFQAQCGRTSATQIELYDLAESVIGLTDSATISGAEALFTGTPFAEADWSFATLNAFDLPIEIKSNFKKTTEDDGQNTPCGIRTEISVLYNSDNLPVEKKTSYFSTQDSNGGSSGGSVEAPDYNVGDVLDTVYFNTSIPLDVAYIKSHFTFYNQGADGKSWMLLNCGSVYNSLCYREIEIDDGTTVALLCFFGGEKKATFWVDDNYSEASEGYYASGFVNDIYTFSPNLTVAASSNSVFLKNLMSRTPFVKIVKPDHVTVEKWFYNTNGSVVETWNYVEGEESESGVNITETVYDKKGNIVRAFAYNSLDSSSKFYDEKEYAENGRVLADIDGTGESKTTYVYDDVTGEVKTSILPNGSKQSFGHDTNTDAVTSITQSTEDGEGNTTNIVYKNGHLVELSSGRTKVEYEYGYSCGYKDYEINNQSIEAEIKTQTKTVKLNGENYTEYIHENANHAERIDWNRDVVTFAPNDSTKKCVVETITDMRGNITKIRMGDSEDELVDQIINEYNEKGQLVRREDKIRKYTAKHTYNSLGQLVRVFDDYSGISLDLNELLEYNNYGQLEFRSIDVFGIGTDIWYTYKDNATRDLKYSTFLGGQITSFPEKDANDRLTARKIGNVIGQDEFNEKSGTYYAYRKHGDHATNMVSSIRYGEMKGEEYVIKDGFKYTYDEMGNITEVKENGKLSVKYTYDSLNRLIREDNAKFKQTYLFTYDNNGNILSKRTARYTLYDTDRITEFLDEKEYIYDEKHPERLQYFGDLDCKYDTLGNPETYKGRTFNWEKGRRLKSVNLGGTSPLEIVYDGYGRRASKGNFNYFYAQDGTLVGEVRFMPTTDVCFGENQHLDDDTYTGKFGISNLYDDSGLMGINLREMSYVAGHQNRYETYCFRRNLQGDIIALIDKDGKVVVRYEYDAWGTHRVYDANGNENTCASFIGNINPYRYRGYYYDTELGLYFLQSRYYDPETGRFINADDISYLDPESINGLNLYAYCGNNPVMYFDPQGNAKKSWWKWLVGALIIVGVAVLTVVTAGVVGAFIGGVGSTIMSSMMVGAAVGAITAGTVNLVSQGIQTGWDGAQFNLGTLAVSTAVGGISGAIGGSGLSLAGQVITNAALGGAQYLIGQSITHDKVTFLGFISNIGIGAFSGLVGGAGWLKFGKGALANAGFTKTMFAVTNAQKELFNQVLGTSALTALVRGAFMNIVSEFLNYHRKMNGR